MEKYKNMKTVFALWRLGCRLMPLHLNKSIKTLQWSSTNRDTKRFLTMTRKIRTQQFYYMYTLFTENRNITCFACPQPGHNKKKQKLSNAPISASYLL